MGSNKEFISPARAGPTAFANILIQVKTVGSTTNVLAFLKIQVTEFQKFVPQHNNTIFRLENFFVHLVPSKKNIS